MCYEQKMNAISRLIIIFTILGYVSTMSLKIVGVGIVTLGIIYFMWMQKTGVEKEGFSKFKGIGNAESSATIKSGAHETTTNPVTLETIIKSDFQSGDKKNPFSNVLLTEIMDNPTRKSAPPAFNPDILEDITTSTKKSTQFLNPGIKNTNKQLFSSLTDKFYLDQSNRSFFSNPNTKIPNDQGAFAQYLYGDMPSCRDGDAIACVPVSYTHLTLPTILRV